MSDRRPAAHWQTQTDAAANRFAAPTNPPTPSRPRMEAADVQTHLRDCGVTVHHAARMPTPRDGRQVVVVFLDDTPEQIDLGRQCAKRLPGVLDVVFSGYNRAIMYLIASPTAQSDQLIAAKATSHHGQPLSSPLLSRPGTVD